MNGTIFPVQISLKLDRDESELRLLKQLQQTRAEIEIRSVIAGFRAAGTIAGSGSWLHERLEKLSDAEMLFTVLYRSKDFGTFQHDIQRPKKGEPEKISIAFSRDPSVLRQLKHNFLVRPDYVGSLLGYPKCCTGRFIELKSYGLLDQALMLALECNEMDLLLSPFFRYAGIGLLMHFPCSCDCQRSIEIASRHVELLMPDFREALVWYSSISYVDLKVHPSGRICVDTELFHIMAPTHSGVEFSKRIKLDNSQLRKLLLKCHDRH